MEEVLHQQNDVPLALIAALNMTSNNDKTNFTDVKPFSHLMVKEWIIMLGYFIV